jgi:porin
MYPSRVPIFLICIIIFFNNDLLADDKDFVDNLTGNWSNKRSNFYNKGLDFDISYIFDSFTNIAGGIKRGTDNPNQLTFDLTIDGERLYNLKGSTMVIRTLTNNGGAFNTHNVGSIQGVDNVEVDHPSSDLYELWIEQKFFEQKFSILAGKQDLSNEFYLTKAASIFIAPTYGTGEEFEVSGINGPSNGFRLKYSSNDNFYIHSGIWSVNYGNVANQSNATVIKKAPLVITEAALLFDNDKYAVGFWQYFKEIIGFNNINKGNNKGIYISLEKSIYKNVDDRELLGFIRAGRASPMFNIVEYGWSAGLVCNSIIKERKDSSLGFGISGIKNSKNFIQAQANNNITLLKNEIAFELTYSDKITPWLQVQPDLQYIIRPGSTPDVSDAKIVGLRLEIIF